MEELNELFAEMLEDLHEAPAGKDILRACLSLGKMLLDKNKRYGNSALSPLRIFSQADTAEQIRVRIDDKLSRLQSGVITQDGWDDAVRDLSGYIILLQIAKARV